MGHFTSMIDIDNFPQYYDYYCSGWDLDGNRNELKVLWDNTLHSQYGTQWFIAMAANYLADKQTETVKVGGKTHKMTLLRWIKRLEKTARADINRERRARRRQDTDRVIAQPVAHHLKPLHLDTNFLEQLEQEWAMWMDPNCFEQTYNSYKDHWKTELEQLRVWAYLKR